MDKKEWVRTHLGNPDEWRIEEDYSIVDSARAAYDNIVGCIVSRSGGTATILWRHSGKITRVPDWDE